MGLGLAFKAFFRCLKNDETSQKIGQILNPESEEKVEPKVVLSSSAQLLAVLQKEGRFIDFLQEDLSGFPDAQIGSVARTVQEGCKKALKQYLELKPVLEEAEGEKVTVESGFDPQRIALVGKVEGEPPFQGVLRHHGWLLEKDSLPRLGAPLVLLSAEVELE